MSANETIIVDQPTTPDNTIIFMKDGGVEVGRLDMSKEPVEFTGNFSEAALIFVQHVVSHISDIRNGYTKTQAENLYVE